MDHLSRLIVVFVLTLMPGLASAEWSWTGTTLYQNSGGTGTQWSSSAAACAALVQPGSVLHHIDEPVLWTTPPSPTTNHVVMWRQGKCQVCPSSNPSCTTQSHQGSFYRRQDWCPTAGHTWNGTVCEAPPPPNACEQQTGQDAGEWQWDAGPGTGARAPSIYLCQPTGSSGSGGCEMITDNPPEFCAVGTDGRWYCTGPAIYTGATCSWNPNGDGGSSNAPRGTGTAPSGDLPGTTGNDPPTPCPAGQMPGTINGRTICTTPGPNTPTQGSTGSNNTTNNADGSTTSTSSQSTTTCQGNQCTTVTNTTVTQCTAAGSCTSQTTTGTGTQDRGGFCRANPNSNQCGGDGEGGFSGSCEGGFQCRGDAVECAVAREQHLRNCTMFDTETALSTIGNDAATGENPADHPRNSAEETPINLSSMIDPAPLFGGSGGCPSNVTVGNYVLPFSRLCDYLPMVRAALLGFAYLVAAFIVFRR